MSSDTLTSTLDFRFCAQFADMGWATPHTHDFYTHGHDLHPGSRHFRENMRGHSGRGTSPFASRSQLCLNLHTPQTRLSSILLHPRHSQPLILPVSFAWYRVCYRTTVLELDTHLFSRKDHVWALALALTDSAPLLSSHPSFHNFAQHVCSQGGVLQVWLL